MKFVRCFPLKLVLLSVLYSFLNARVHELQSFLKPFSEKEQALINLRILCNYAKNDLSATEYLNLFQLHIMTFLEKEPNSERDIELAKALLNHAITLHANNDELKSPNHNLFFFAERFFEKYGNSVAFFIEPISDEKYAFHKAKFYQELNQGTCISDLSGEGFFSIEKTKIYWYPPAAQINPTPPGERSKLPNDDYQALMQHLHNVIKIDVRKYFLPCSQNEEVARKNEDLSLNFICEKLKFFIRPTCDTKLMENVDCYLRVCAGKFARELRLLLKRKPDVELKNYFQIIKFTHLVRRQLEYQVQDNSNQTLTDEKSIYLEQIKRDVKEIFKITGIFPGLLALEQNASEWLKQLDVFELETKLELANNCSEFILFLSRLVYSIKIREPFLRNILSSATAQEQITQLIIKVNAKLFGQARASNSSRAIELFLIALEKIKLTLQELNNFSFGLIESRLRQRLKDLNKQKAKTLILNKENQ